MRLDVPLRRFDDGELFADELEVSLGEIKKKLLANHNPENSFPAHTRYLLLQLALMLLRFAQNQP